MKAELTKTLEGIEMHLKPAREALRTGDDAAISKAIWELGTMCSLCGKKLKDMSLEMERMKPPAPVPQASPVEKPPPSTPTKQLGFEF